MQQIYLDNAATSIPDPYVLDAATTFAEKLRGASAASGDLTRFQTQLLVQARLDMAKFLNCRSNEIALVQSTSHALGTLAGALPLRKGDNVLICDLEYQASTACWHPRAEQAGFELRQVKTTNGRITAEDFSRYLDKNTRVILLAAVQEINGFRADIKEISALAKSHNCYFIVDGIQEAGSIQVDVKELGMDFYCAGGKKWLGNPFGLGFLYISERMLSELQPPYYSYLDLQVPDRYYSSEKQTFVQAYLSYLEDPLRNPFDDFSMKKDASVFEAGGYANYIGALGLSRALEVLNRHGMSRVEQRIRARTDLLDRELRNMGLFVNSPSEDKHRSAIVSFSLHDLRDHDVERERALVHYLRDQGILVSLRCSTDTGGIRVSPHYYTPECYVDALLNALEDYLKKNTLAM